MNKKLSDDINEAIQDINNDIIDLQNRKKLLESLDLNDVITEEKWHELCVSYLRTSNVLAHFVKNIFPNATNISVGCNYVTFYLYDIKCYLPTSFSKGIEIDVSWFLNLKYPTYKSFKSDRLYKLEKFIDSSSDWKDKTEAIIGRGYKTWYLWFKWNFNIKYNIKKYNKEYEECKQHTDENYAIAIEKYKAKLSDQKEIINTIENKLIPELNKFTNIVRAYYEQSLVYNKSLDYILDYYKNEEVSTNGR